MSKIIYPIVKPFLPNLKQYQKYIESAYQCNWLTNCGPLHQELEYRLKEYLGVSNLILVANGTLALQVAYKVLNLAGEIITTPFTFAATPSSLIWQGLKPKFVDINKDNLNIDLTNAPPELLNSAKAIVPVHVFGNPCEVELVDQIAKNHQLKVIYDAAHAFGGKYKDTSLLNYGDASTLSLHATKLFHCVEGGAIIFKDKDLEDKARRLINFGFNNQNIPSEIGINAKMSEVHAAMGLTNLSYADDIISHRQELVKQYKLELNNAVTFQNWHSYGENNGAYMPVILESENTLLEVMRILAGHGIQTRRYFYPSLSEMSVYEDLADTPNSYDISRRILCLPLYFELSVNDVVIICSHLKNALNRI